MAKIWYRLKFKNGTYSAWSSDYDEMKRSANFFKAKIESRIFKPMV